MGKPRQSIETSFLVKARCLANQSFSAFAEEVTKPQVVPPIFFARLFRFGASSSLENHIAVKLIFYSIDNRLDTAILMAIRQ